MRNCSPGLPVNIPTSRALERDCLVVESRASCMLGRRIPSQALFYLRQGFMLPQLVELTVCRLG